MKVGGRFHLAYCSNIHPGEDWPTVRDALGAALPDVRRQLSIDGPMAVGLRISARAAEDLAEPATLEAFRHQLRDLGCYVPTINAFPYGAFHGTRVKERVYLPDWRAGARVDYTNRTATILSALLQDHPGIEGSVSTVPGAFRSAAASPVAAADIARGLLRHAAHLVDLRRRTGTTIVLAVEPEPSCFLETTTEAAEFFLRHLFVDEAARAAGAELGVTMNAADVRRHVGLCLDLCHMAVEFEDLSDQLTRLAREGIRVAKVQVSSALSVANPVRGSASRLALTRFAEDTYLHQVVERTSAGVRRFTDLPEALEAPEPPGTGGGVEWRVHFHVPVFLESMEAFGTTQGYLAEALSLLARTATCGCFEVETYTWDVLPPEYRTVDLHTAIARELAWVRGRLEP